MITVWSATRVALYLIMLLAGLAAAVVAAYPPLIRVDTRSAAVLPTVLVLILGGGIMFAVARIRLAAELRSLRGLPPVRRAPSRYRMSREASSAAAGAAALAVVVVVTYWLVAA